MCFCKKNYTAYAKVNFGLNVLPKIGGEQKNEYHNLESIFQTVDLYDVLTVEKNDSTFCTVICNDMELPEKNTLTNAYDAFFEITGLKKIGICVELKKGIPSGGGLGGGSSDAAALVRALQEICDIKLNRNQLDFIASKTGSDVFFFMNCDEQGKGCALVWGRGENVKKISPRKDLFLVLIFPQQNSSTKEAYALLDEAYKRGEKLESPSFDDFENIYNRSVEDWTFINSFTPVISNSCEEIRLALKDLQKVGCCYSEMSGSGSTVYGVFTLRQQAISASNLLGEAWKCKLVQTV